MRISLISDTHAKHNQVVTTTSMRKPNQELDLPGGDLLIHAGDFMTHGYSQYEAEDFFKWFDAIDNYENKVFIAGNHDRVMQYDPEWAQGVLTGYKTIDYLLDEDFVIYGDGPNGDMPEENVRIYGSPWQPEFFQWAYNLPRNGEELKARWDAIPHDTDILVTHSPAWGMLDDTERRRGTHLGCELLTERIKQIRPKIHVCGHIHSGHGHYFDGHTHYFNAAVLDEQYMYTQSPWHFEWDSVTNEINWLT